MFDLLIIHLSDIHISDKSDAILSRAELIANAVRSEILTADNIIICITGDIANRGKSKEYELATGFISDLQDHLKSHYKFTPHVLICPGNHDGDFDHPSASLRKMLIKKQKDDSDEIIPEFLDHCCEIFSDYEDFRGAVETMHPTEFSKVWRKYEFSLNGRAVNFHSINNAWSAEIKLQPGALRFPVSMHADISSSKGALNIALLHCPSHWLTQSIYKNFKKLVNEKAQIVLSGHEHNPNSGYSDDTATGRSTFVEAGALYERGSDHSSFGILGIDFLKSTLFSKTLEFNGRLYHSPNDFFHEINLNLDRPTKNDYQLSPSWLEQLNDIGAAIKHTAKSKIDLLDLFIYPDLDQEEDAEETSPIVSSKSLLDLTSSRREILIKGEQGIGKSALLRAFALSIHEQGYIPILIDGLSLKSSSARDLQKIIHSAIEGQYGKQRATEISQLPADSKILLLDNIDRVEFPDKYFNEVIKAFRNAFGWIVASADKLFDFRAAVHGDTFSALHEFESFSIKPFGIKARHELVRKWFQLEPADSQASEKRIERNIGEGVKILSSVVGRGLVPPFPIYMLVLLQGAEAGKQGELENSALGTYYQYLLVHSLLDHATQDQVKGIFNYCAHLAWFFRQQSQSHIIEKDFRSFHSAFESHFDLNIDFNDRLSLLLKSRIITESSNNFSFKYPYSYYYFLGQYLSAKMSSDQEVDGIVREAAEALHVRENANTLLFVAHHSQSTVVIDLIMKSINGLFSQATPLEFGADTKELNRAVDQLPKLVFNENETSKKQAEILEEETSISTRMEDASNNVQTSEGYDNQKETINALKIVADLNALFKGIEILGAALKANADGIETKEKQKIINTIFDGGLRGVKSLFEKLISEPDYLIGEMQVLLDRKRPSGQSEKRRVASQAIFFFLSSLAYIFIRRMGTAVGSKILKPALNRYAQENPTIAKRLVNLSCLLETPGALPLSEIRELSTQLENQAFPLSILRQLGLARVYLYHTDAIERQQLCSDLDIEMQVQRSINYQTRNSKRVNPSN